jgi:hypothetical protein
MTADPRPIVNADLLRTLPGRLTDRDRYIIRLLGEHTVLTSNQIGDIGFTNQRVAERRMQQLYRLRVVDRVRPIWRPGTAPYHWLLDEAGAVVLAADRGIQVRDLGWNRRRVLDSIMSGQRLAHLVGVNGFFTALIRTARGSDSQQRLAKWWSERRCAAQWRGVVEPDGFGVWIDGRARVPFLLEFDCGTERPGTRLAAKLPGYARLAAADATRWWLLFRFPGRQREENMRRALAGAAVPVATTSPAAGETPAGPVWLPLTWPSSARRVTLGALTTDAPPQ